jgi:hypothetical protein
MGIEKKELRIKNAELRIGLSGIGKWFIRNLRLNNFVRFCTIFLAKLSLSADRQAPLFSHSKSISSYFLRI